MEDKKKSSSFPSNYVTFVQLQERQQKRKEEEQQQQEEEDQKQMQDVAEKVEPKSKSMRESFWRLRRRVKGEPLVTKEVEVVGGDGADQEGEGEEKPNKKKNKKNKNWKGNKPSLTAKKEVNGEGVLAEATLASVERVDAPASGNHESKGEAKAEKYSLDKTSNVEPRSKVLSGNGGIGKGSDRFRRKGEKRNRERRGTRGKTRAENGDLNKMADTEPKFTTALSVDGGILKVNDELGETVEINNQESRGNGSVTRADSHSLDQTADIEPKFRALSVNGLLGKKNDGLKRNGEKRNRESGGRNRETMAECNNLDQTAHVEPVFRDFSVNHRIDKGYNGLRRSGAYHGHGHREFGRFGRRAVQNLRDGNMVWVKRGEVSDGVGYGCVH